MLSDKALHQNSLHNQLLMSEIYSDNTFNMRERILASDIMELQRDVQTNGLINPVSVRILWEQNPKELEQIKLGKKYFLIAGFRRFMAMRTLQADKIPAVVMDVKSDYEAHDINAKENLQRADLSLWEEAKAVKHYWIASETEEFVGKILSKSRGWVQTRFQLLGMPTEIQQAAHQGYLLADDIRNLARYRGDELLAVAGRVVDARRKGDKTSARAATKRKDTPHTRKRRSEADIYEMGEIIRRICLSIDRSQEMKVEDIISKYGNLIVCHRLIAWICGEITNLEMHSLLQEFARKFGSDHEIPTYQETNI